MNRKVAEYEALLNLLTQFLQEQADQPQVVVSTTNTSLILADLDINSWDTFQRRIAELSQDIFAWEAN